MPEHSILTIRNRLFRLWKTRFPTVSRGEELDDVWGFARAEFRLGDDSPHGTAHWRNVEENALRLSVWTGAQRAVIRLFAPLHDVAREDDTFDPEHGRRAAALLPALNRRLFHLSEEHLVMLQTAIAGHADGTCSDDPTIGTCWDADRLDLTRFGTAPAESLMSTAEGKRLAGRLESAKG